MVVVSETDQESLLQESENSTLTCWTQLKVVRHIQKGLNASKFDPKWKGPYTVKEAYDGGYLRISTPDPEDLCLPLMPNCYSCVIFKMEVKALHVDF